MGLGAVRSKARFSSLWLVLVLVPLVHHRIVHSDTVRFGRVRSERQDDDQPHDHRRFKGNKVLEANTMVIQLKNVVSCVVSTW